MKNEKLVVLQSSFEFVDVKKLLLLLHLMLISSLILIPHTASIK